MPFITDLNTPIPTELYASIKGIGANGTLKIEVDVGQTYNEIELECLITATPPTRAEFNSMWGDMTVQISGEPLVTFTAKQWIDMIEFYDTGSIGDTGSFRIPFQRLWMTSRADQLNPALGLLKQRSCTITIQQNSSTIDGIKVNTQVNPVAEELGAYVRYERLTLSPPGSGVRDVKGLPVARLPGERLMAMHIEFDTIGDLTDFSILCDNVTVYDQITPARLAKMYKQVQGNRRTIQTAYNTLGIDFCYRGYAADALPMSYKNPVLRLNLNSAPTEVNVLCEILTYDPASIQAAG